MQIVKDPVNKKIFITREFDAPQDKVWEAWTSSEILDQWWAPKPWKARTKAMEFSDGGKWIYAMVGPDGTEQWCRVDFRKISPLKSFTAVDVFCDEKGNTNTDLPVMEWKCEFNKTNSGTTVKIEISFSSEADLNKIVEMGFEEGFTSALTNLDELFEVLVKN